MAFRSRFSGTICRNCGKVIEKGDFITWTRRQAGESKAKVSHLNCNAPTIEPTQPVVNPVQVTGNTPIISEESEEKTLTIVENGEKSAFGVLADALLPYIDSKINGKVDRTHVLEIVNEAIAKAYKPLSIEITRDGETVRKVDNAHTRMPELLYLLAKREHVYLYGPPGSGKSTAAKQSADALGVQFGYISLNPQTPDSRLMGFIDANGNYRETVFYKLYRDGGVFCIDEMDNASPSLLTTLNSCLENGHASFPNGMIERHADFVLVATGNTCGKGANPMFPERRPFDAAFAERFSYIEWDYDEKLESLITLAINPKASAWLAWIQNTRKYCATHYPKVLLTPRASFKGARYLADSGWTTRQIADAVVFKGLDSGTVTAILSANPLDKVS